MYCMQCFLKSKYTKSRTFNDKNRWIVQKVMVFKNLLQHLATRGTYSPGDWRCYEAWREQTLVYPPVMCQQRLIYCTWELNVMRYIRPSHKGTWLYWTVSYTILWRHHCDYCKCHHISYSCKTLRLYFVNIILPSFFFTEQSCKMYPSLTAIS